MKTNKPILIMSTVAVALAAAIAGAEAAGGHVKVTPQEITWAEGPPSIPDGARATVLYGSPGESGLFALRLKLPAGYVLPPHHHSQPEVVTVISGTFHLGMGDTVDRDSARALEAGSFFAFPPGMTHYAFTEEETVIQLNSTGPWDLSYVDPADDPRKQ